MKPPCFLRGLGGSDLNRHTLDFSNLLFKPPLIRENGSWSEGKCTIVTLESLLDPVGCVADNQDYTEAEQQDQPGLHEAFFNAFWHGLTANRF